MSNETAEARAPTYDPLQSVRDGARLDGTTPMTPGDVLIRTLAGGKGAAYALSGLPDADEVLFPSMRAASQYARAYARPTGVDVWAEQGSGYLLLVGRFRPAGDRVPG